MLLLLFSNIYLTHREIATHWFILQALTTVRAGSEHCQGQELILGLPCGLQGPHHSLPPEVHLSRKAELRSESGLELRQSDTEWELSTWHLTLCHMLIPELSSPRKPSGDSPVHSAEPRELL